jgi:hypothetical protein
VVMFVVIVTVAIVVSPVAVVVVLMVPMSLVHLPAFAIVVIVWMTPVCPFKRRMLYEVKPRLRLGQNRHTLGIKRTGNASIW